MSAFLTRCVSSWQTLDSEACVLQVTQPYLDNVLWCEVVRLICIWQCSTSSKDRLNEAFGHFWAQTEAGCLDCCREPPPAEAIRANSLLFIVV